MGVAMPLTPDGSRHVIVRNVNLDDMVYVFNKEVPVTRLTPDSELQRTQGGGFLIDLPSSAAGNGAAMNCIGDMARALADRDRQLLACREVLRVLVSDDWDTGCGCCQSMSGYDTEEATMASARACLPEFEDDNP